MKRRTNLEESKNAGRRDFSADDMKLRGRSPKGQIKGFEMSAIKKKV